jgi:hypothetical protein
MTRCRLSQCLRLHQVGSARSLHSPRRIVATSAARRNNPRLNGPGRASLLMALLEPVGPQRLPPARARPRAERGGRGAGVRESRATDFPTSCWMSSQRPRSTSTSLSACSSPQRSHTSSTSPAPSSPGSSTAPTTLASSAAARRDGAFANRRRPSSRHPNPRLRCRCSSIVIASYYSPKSSSNRAPIAHTSMHTPARPISRKHWTFSESRVPVPSRTTRPPHVPFGWSGSAAGNRISELN